MLKVLAFLASTTAVGAIAAAEEPIRYDEPYRAEERRDEWRERRADALRDLDARLAGCHSYRCRRHVRHEWRAEHPRMRY